MSQPFNGYVEMTVHATHSVVATLVCVVIVIIITIGEADNCFCFTRVAPDYVEHYIYTMIDLRAWLLC